VTVFLVRHAKAGSRERIERWDGPDRERPLTKSGRRQAEGLVGLLAEDAVTRVLSSPYVRCMQTVESLAAARHLTVEADGRLAEGAGADAALGLITALDAAVLCSHADVIAAVVMTLADQGTPLRPALAWDKGSTWALEVSDGRVVSGRYLPPP
jgi:phosphohistidine phosphatase SixA